MPRLSAATFASLTALLLAAPGAFAATNIEVVATNNTLTNNSGAPNFTPTGASSKVGANLINAELNAGNDVTLDTSPDNLQSGTITVNAGITGTHVNGDLTLNADDTITQSQAISVNGALAMNATGTFSFTAIGINADISSASLTLNSTFGDISQTAGAITATGLSAGAAAITLGNPANDFSTVAVISASDVTLADANGLVFGPSLVGGGLTATASGPLAQTIGPLLVGGATAATGSPVTLDQADNDFVGAVAITSSGGSAATVDDTNDLTLGSSTSGDSLTATADGDLTVPAAATIAAADDLRIVADDSNPSAPAIGAGGITVGANAALTGAGAIRLYGSRRGDNSVAGTATFNGSTFTPGTIFVNSAREQWGVYSPAGTATAPFTFFYKDTDTSTPQATITTPANGATYERGEVVNAAYSCSDGGGGSGVTSCAGTVANGGPIDTSTTGQKTFKVDVASGSGREGTSTVTYNVVDPPDPDPPAPDPAVEVIGLERDRDRGTATLTVSTNLPGTLHVEKTNKVKGFGPVQLDQAGEGELEVVARDKAAKTLERTGRVTVNPRAKFAPAGLDYEIGVRHEFELRLD